MKRLFTSLAFILLIQQVAASDDVDATTFTFLDFPGEIHAHIASFCDQDSLHALRLASTDFYRDPFYQKQIDDRFDHQLTRIPEGVGLHVNPPRASYFTLAVRSTPKPGQIGHSARKYINRSLLDYINTQLQQNNEPDFLAMLMPNLLPHPLKQHLKDLFVSSCMGSDAAAFEFSKLTLGEFDTEDISSFLANELQADKPLLQNLRRWDLAQHARPLTQSRQASNILEKLGLDFSKGYDTDALHCKLSSFYYHKEQHRSLILWASESRDKLSQVTDAGPALDELDQIICFLAPFANTNLGPAGAQMSEVKISSFPSVCFLRAALVKKSQRFNYLFECLHRNFSPELSLHLFNELYDKMQVEKMTDPILLRRLDRETLKRTKENANRIRHLIIINELSRVLNPVDNNVYLKTKVILRTLNRLELWPTELRSLLPNTTILSDYVGKAFFLKTRLEVFKLLEEK